MGKDDNDPIQRLLDSGFMRLPTDAEWAEMCAPVVKRLAASIDREILEMVLTQQKAKRPAP